jgi:putative transposase
VLAAHRRTADAADVKWKAAIDEQVWQEMIGNELTIVGMCELAGVSRKGFYRFDPDGKPTARDMDLQAAIQRIALEMPSYGRPRITAELRRRGWVVNAKRVHRIMREDNLLCLRRRKFLVTTD